MVFYENEWNHELCKMTELKQESDKQSRTIYFKCDCQVDGYIAIGTVIVDEGWSQIVDKSIERLWYYTKDVQFK